MCYVSIVPRAHASAYARSEGRLFALPCGCFTGLGNAERVDSFDAVPEGSEFAARVYAAINARDREAIRGLSAPDIVVGTTVEAYRGAEAVIEWMDEGDDAFDDFTVELLEVQELAGHVVASMRQRGRGKARGAVVDHRFTHVWTLRDGRAIRMQSFAHRDDAVRYAQRGGPA